MHVFFKCHGSIKKGTLSRKTKNLPTHLQSSLHAVGNHEIPSGEVNHKLLVPIMAFPLQGAQPGPWSYFFP